MTSNINYKGTDIDFIYENPPKGGLTLNKNWSVAGVDISNRYSSLATASEFYGNVATRIPPTRVLFSGIVGNNDLSEFFVGNPGQYSITTLDAPSSSIVRTISSRTVFTHQFTVTFSSAQALTDYFYYGGRIMISAANQGSFTPGTPDSIIQRMLSEFGTVIVYDEGHYKTGIGGFIYNNTVGANDLGTSTVLLFATSVGDPYYTPTGYSISARANAAPGQATELRFTILLILSDDGGAPEVYQGTRVSNIQQRNYSGVVPDIQPAPIYTLEQFDW